MAEYKKFLSEIGYLAPEGAPFTITTSSVDPEIAEVPGPQLVCPVDNPRFILNAANARW
jgi:malate synthase